MPDAPPPPSDNLATRTGIDPFASLGESSVEVLAAPASNTRASDTPPAPPAPAEGEKKPEPAPAVEEGKKAEPAPSAQSQWSVDKLLEAIGKKDVKPDSKEWGDWKTQKDNFKKVVELNLAKEAEITELKSTYETDKAKLQAELAEARKSGSTADVATVQAEIAQLKASHEAELKEYREWKAKTDLENNVVFRREYDGKRVEIYNSAKEAASELGVTEEGVKAVFDATSELQMRKAIKALELDDETGEQLLTEKALAYLQLSKQKEAILSGKKGRSVAEEAADWEAHQAQFQGALTKSLTSELQGQALRAVDSAVDRLSTKSALFKTEGGAEVLNSIRNQFTAGFDLPMETVVDALALAAVAPIWEQRAIETAKKNADLEARLKVLEGSVPGANLKPAQQTNTPATPANTAPWQSAYGPREGIDPYAALAKR